MARAAEESLWWTRFQAWLGAFGFAGILDIATETGLERNSQDLGKTFGRWGTGTGAYIVWPLFGPSTVRDSIALPLDRAASPAILINDGRTQFALTTLQIVNTRANLLGASQVFDDIALDKYTFLRDAYLQRRRSLIYDGNDPGALDGKEGDDGYAPQTPDAPAGAASGPASLPQSAASAPAPAASAASAAN